MNLREMYKKYGSGHIAFLDDKVIAHDKTFKKVFEVVKEKGLFGNKRLRFGFIPSEEAICVYIQVSI
ncbi:MAG: DUF5678 domain-containing protein [Methanosarcinales archaeon]